MACFIPAVPLRVHRRASALSSNTVPRSARQRHGIYATVSPMPVPRHAETIQEIDSIPSLLIAVAARPEMLFVLEAYSNGCRPCIGMRRAYQRAAEEYSGRARFARVNVDRVPDVRQYLDVRGLPFFVFYKNGVRIDHFASASVDRLEECIVDNE